MANPTDAEIRADMEKVLANLREANAIARRLAKLPRPRGYRAMTLEWAKGYPRPMTKRAALFLAVDCLDGGTLGEDGKVDPYAGETESLEKDLAKADAIAAVG